MKLNNKEVLVCNCEGTMDIDGKALAKACAPNTTPEALNVASHLCRTQIEEFQRLAGSNDQLLVACTQEAPVFLETLDEINTNGPDIRFTNIREKAGWSKDSTKKSPATAKMAALLAEAALDIEGTTSVNMISKGVLLILGKDEAAIDAARKVANRLDVTVLLETGASLTPPSLMDIPVFTGRVTDATGHLGQFQVSIEDFAPASASSRQSLAFDVAGQTGTSVCDLILDIRGATPLFTAPEKRDGYFNPDPKNPALVGDALLELVDMVGEFEKPRYINYDEAMCAHTSAGITGCTRCIDNCPTGAITSDEKNDRVAFDAYICAGCGTCASICPTGAAKYNLPGGDALFTRLRTILSAYRNAGGERPEILVHDAQYGEDMIATMARLGGGLPSNVLPFAVNEVTSLGLDFLLASAAFGAERTMILLPPSKADEKAVLESELVLAEAVFDGLGFGTGHALILDNQDPDAIEKILYAIKTTPPMPAGDFLPMGRKRSVMSLALASLHAKAPNKIDVLELPAGAPFGAVMVDTENCTLCLACVGACPTGALKDNEDKPQLSFIEEACVQCGLCKNTCPEKVISLTPRLSFLGTARTAQVIKEEEPFECIRCNKAFGTRSTIENMVKKLEQHPMFQDKGGTERLKMCNDCRVFAMAEEDEHPLAGAARPKTRTTEDYLNEREELRQLAAKDMEEKGLAGTDTEGEA
ncbi:MAG: 4Fe-4S binding protein [Proteobacteria bacterium]|nr:4Fe-4S binding protein [Pseudomonadota bacterium]